MTKRSFIDYDTGEIQENVSKGVKNLDEFGRELPDPTPVAPPVGYFKQPSMVEIIREQVRVALSQQAAAQGFETFEEADDFDVADDFDPTSPYEQNFDPTPASELRRRASEESGGAGGSPPAEAPSGAPQAPASQAPSTEAPK